MVTGGCLLCSTVLQNNRNLQLKQSILRVKVPQIEGEGTGEDLYKQILAEKGKLKKQNPLPEISEDEIPFEIPASWKWVPIGNTFEVRMGQSPNGNSVVENGGGIEFHQGKVFFSDKVINKSNQTTTQPTKIAPRNSVLLCVRAPVGKVNITDREICIGRGLCSLSTLGNTADYEYLYIALHTFEKIFNEKATGTTFVAITGKVVNQQAFPLPPTAEQKRIVLKAKELLGLVDELEKYL